jgi:hypothetical protein
MNEEQQRIEIAEACGFAKDWDFKKAQPCQGWCVDSLPDYLNDLNAMHEAERILNPILAADYARILTSIAWESEQPVFAPITASAAQRAEAFLKTLDLWKP